MNTLDNVYISKFPRTMNCVIDYVNDGSIIFDDKYFIPSVVNNVSFDVLDVMLRSNILNLYAVKDERGYLHMNKSDIDWLTKWVQDAGENMIKAFHRRNVELYIIYIDYNTPEEDKTMFWRAVFGQLPGQQSMNHISK
ncbi:hypothetical protein [uncultured Methanobrevibacter sp.]|uniref:hypothetical protein n=1 Tax=uncultured Methanobrevibacter sp. TaxID=253161 RepID=UPI0025F04AD5|nr:hypothetical protein [uncultured Methanobrevibacter sp.]